VLTFGGQIDLFEDEPASDEAQAEATELLRPLIERIQASPVWPQLEEKLGPVPDDIALRTFWYGTGCADTGCMPTVVYTQACWRHFL
jgi:hypothetical protein